MDGMIRAKKFFELHGAKLGAGIALGCALVWRYVLKLDFYIPKDPRSILTTAITVSSIAIGFIATAKSVLLTMRNSRAGKNMDKYSLFPLCTSYFMSSIKGLMLFTAVSAAGLFVPSKSDPRWLVDAFCITWFVSAVWAAMLTWRTLWIYEAFARKVSE